MASAIGGLTNGVVGRLIVSVAALRSGNHIELDGKIIQKDGVWID
jgi:hypothetical protein